MIIIYKHLINGKPYIGQSTNFKKRCHISSYKNSKKVYNAMKIYGCDFSKSLILAQTEDINEANELESKFIKEYDSVKNGWNSFDKETRTHRGSNNNFSDEHKKHLSEAMKGNKNQRPAGWKQTEECKRKQSERMKNKFKENPDAHYSCKIICENTGIIYNSILDASLKNNLNETTLQRYLNGTTKKLRCGLIFKRLKQSAAELRKTQFSTQEVQRLDGEKGNQ
nr:MAG TPA: intron associated endonuclease [Caudoviricetes sp.]